MRQTCQHTGQVIPVNGKKLCAQQLQLYKKPVFVLYPRNQLYEVPEVKSSPAYDKMKAFPQ